MTDDLCARIQHLADDLTARAARLCPGYPTCADPTCTGQPRATMSEVAQLVRKALAEESA